MRRDSTLAGVALLTYLGYYGLPDAEQRSWAYYVAVGALVCLFAWRELPHAESALGAWACWYVLAESTQQTVCGVAQWREPMHTDLCVQWLGPDIYRGMAAAAVATTIALLWPPRKPG